MNTGFPFRHHSNYTCDFLTNTASYITHYTYIRKRTIGFDNHSNKYFPCCVTLFNLL